jgi:hypothetical protein
MKTASPARPTGASESHPAARKPRSARPIRPTPHSRIQIPEPDQKEIDEIYRLVFSCGVYGRSEEP